MFVHCAMGRSRSATCVIMYAMKRFGVSFDDVNIRLLMINLGFGVRQVTKRMR